MDNRQSISRTELQLAIADAVRKYDPVCEVFVGVIIQRETPKSLNKSTQAITIIVARMQREYHLTADLSEGVSD